uniref:Uncharacterized protein n=1 Tax=Eutreptiella gymnastica TaxID=73025 RepID=A0A7S4G5G5_9EUGL
MVDEKWHHALEDSGSEAASDDYTEQQRSTVAFHDGGSELISLEGRVEAIEIPTVKIVEKIVTQVVEVPVVEVVEKVVEVLVEKIVEVPVEKIVEKIVEKVVVKTVEVPVEKIVEKIVEIPVEVPVYRTVEKVKEVVVHHKVEKLVEVPVEKIVKVSKDGKRLTGAKKVSAPSSRYSGSGVNKASRCDDTCSRISSISGSMAYKKSTTAHDDASTVTSKMARSPWKYASASQYDDVTSMASSGKWASEHQVPMYGNQKGRLRSSSSFNDELSLISGSTDYQRNRRDRLQKYEESLHSRASDKADHKGPRSTPTKYEVLKSAARPTTGPVSSKSRTADQSTSTGAGRLPRHSDVGVSNAGPRRGYGSRARSVSSSSHGVRPFRMYDAMRPT